MNCSQGLTTGMAWALVIGVIGLLIVYGTISSNMQTRRIRAKRELEMPSTSSIRIDEVYNLFLKGGKLVPNLVFVGVVRKEDVGAFDVANRMIVFTRATGERMFIRQASIQMIEAVARS